MDDTGGDQPYRIHESASAGQTVVGLLGWAFALSGYAQTPATFMAFTADKQIIGGALLPKRGLADPGQQGVLRALLDGKPERI